MRYIRINPYHVAMALVVMVACGLYGNYIKNVRPRYWEVKGSSMEPVLYTGDIILCKKYTYKMNLGRYDMILVDGIADHLSVKCILGLPGDTVKFSKDNVYLNCESVKYPNPLGFELECTLAEGEYFVVGVNAENSIDSRYIGTIKQKQIKAVFLETQNGSRIDVAEVMNW